MSHFFGRRRVGTGGDGYSDHGQLSGLLDDDHPQYLITTAIRSVIDPASGIIKTGFTAGDVFSITNAGTGAAIFIKQTGTTTNADAALDIDNSTNTGRGLSVFSNAFDPDLPLVQFSALSPLFDEPVLLITHADRRGLALEVAGDAYVSGQILGTEAVTFTPQYGNPIDLGETGLYIEGYPGTLYYVDQNGNKFTFGLDEKVKISSTDTVNDYLLNKLVAGPNITITQSNIGGDEKIIIASTASGTGQIAAGDGYYPFVDIDELTMAGLGSGTLSNISGIASSGSIYRKKYNSFLIGKGTLDIKGLTLRSTIDADMVPEVTYDVIKNATLIDDNLSNTELFGGTLLVTDQPTVESEVFVGSRKDGEIRFTTGAIDFDIPAFYDGTGFPDGYFYFVFHANHTLDTKTIVVERSTVGPYIKHIHFTYPFCATMGVQQTSIKSGQSFDVEVATAFNPDGYAQTVSVQVEAGDAVQSLVSLSETFPGSGIWTGTVVARTGQPNGPADINVTAYDLLANSITLSTSDIGDELIIFDNNSPVIETFEEGSDLAYPPGQSCIKFGETVDAYMTASDFTEILYTSPNGRFTITNPTVYETTKIITWDLLAASIEENADITNPVMLTDNVRIRARKASNCSETIRYMQIRLDDTPPNITSIRWRRNNIGAYNLTSPVLGVGTHGVQVIFDDPLVILPEIIVQDSNKGTLSAFSGTLPGTTFTATLVVSDPPDTDGCTELILVTGINCSHKLPLSADPINGSEEEFCIDVRRPDIDFVEIDIDLIDGYWNDGYDGYNVMDDDSDNLDNTSQACEVNFSNGVQSITSNDILTRHAQNTYVTVKMLTPIETGDTCVFDASPWGASSVLAVPKRDGWLYQGPFVPNLGSTRNDDKSRAIGRASIWHATGNNATVTDLALNTDTATNIDVLSANGIDVIASPISFIGNGTSGGVFTVSVDSFKAFMIGRTICITANTMSTIYRTVRQASVDGGNGQIVVDGGSLVGYSVANNAQAVPLSATDAEVKAWNSSLGLVAYVDDSAFTHITLCDFANPESFSQHLTNDQLTQNNSGTVGLNLFRAAFWGSKLSVPNTNGGTEANPTGVANSKYVWRSKKLRLTTNPTGIQGTNLRFMVFGFAAGTQFRNVDITAPSDWDQNSNRFDLGNNDSQIDIRISVDEPYTQGVQPITNANWYLTTDYEVSPQSGFKFGKTKDINIVFSPPSTDIVDKDIFVEITLYTNASGKAPQLDMLAFAYLT